MNRVRAKELMLVAVASSLLAFEAIGLRGALPTAMRSLASEGVLAALTGASHGAAVATASVLGEAGTSAANVAAGAARLLGTVTPAPPTATRALEVATLESTPGHMCTLTVTTTETRRVHRTACGAARERAVQRAAALAKASTL